MIILYCEKCGKRVDERAVASGDAQVDGQGHAICGSCAPPKRKDSRRNIAPALGASKSPSTRIVQSPGKTVALPQSKAAEPRRNMVSIGIGVTVACVVLFAGAWYFGIRTPSEKVRMSRITDTPTTTPPQQDPLVPPHGTTARPPLLPQNDPGTSRPGPVSPPPPQASTTKNGDTYDPRGMMANSLLIQAKDYYAKFPRAPWIYKEKLENLINRYSGTPAADEAAKIVAEGHFASRPPSKEADRVPGDTEWRKALELLPSADPTQDSIRPGWSWKGDLLSSSDHAWMTIPYTPSEEYDLRVVFVRQSGGECLGINLPRIDRACTFVLCAWGDVGHGFEMIQNRRADEQPGYTPRPGLIQNGKTNVLVIQVRRGVLKAWLNGRLLAEAQAAADQTMPHEHWDPKRLDRLAIGSWGGCVYEIRSLKILEWSGEGAFLRPPPAKTIPDTVAFAPDTRGGETPDTTTPSGSPPSTSTSPVKPVDITVSLPDASARPDTPSRPAGASPKATYAIFLTQFWSCLAKKNWTGAQRHVTDAKANPKLASFKAALELDGELARQAEAAEQAVEAGAALLKDGRPFILQQKDVRGVRKIAVGQGGTATIDRIRNRTIDISERMGGGQIGFSLPIDTLLPVTCQALAEMYLKDQPQGFLTLAAGRFASIPQPDRDEEFMAWTKKAEKDSVSALRARQLTVWLEFQKAEQAARKAFAEVESLLESKNAEKTLAALDQFSTQHADTAFAMESRNAAEELREKAQTLMREPGLWATYWSASQNKRFERMVFAQAERVTYDLGIVEKLPSDKIPRVFFDLRYEGMLRIAQAGSYEFKLEADDRIGLWIDEKPIRELSGGGNPFQKVDLSAGDHTLRIEYSNDAGGGFFVVKWKPPGATGEHINIPAENLWHRKGQEVRP